MTPSSSTTTRVMARTLRRTCPPHTRIARKSGIATSSPVAASTNTSNSSFANSYNGSFHTSPAASSQYGCASSSQTRGFHANPRYQYATKDAQDKDSLKPRSTEYSKSGSDDTAAHDDVAFDPKQTKPETEEKNMGGSSNPTEGNPLSVSPGNPQVSKARDPQEGGAQNATGENRKRTSGAGNPTKHG